MPILNQGSKAIIPKKATSGTDFASLNNKWEYRMQKKEIALLPVNYFGDSSDGDVTISADTSLTSTEDGDMIVMNYGNLTIDATKTLTVDNRCRGLLLFVDGDLTVNGTISMTGRGCHANPADSIKSGWIDVPTAGYSYEGDATNPANAFNGTIDASQSSCAYKTGAALNLGVDFGATKKINKVVTYGANDYGYSYPTDTGETITLTLEGSTTGAWSGEEVELDQQIFTDALSEKRTFSTTTFWSYRYYRVTLSAGSGTQVQIVEMLFYGEDTDYHNADTPVAPGDGHAVDSSGIQIPFFTATDTDALACKFEGCGTDAYALNALFSEGEGKVISFPRVGASGGAAATSADGNTGDAGTAGQCGGGGSGGARYGTSESGDGGDATCFSGGSGSGAAVVSQTSSSGYSFGGAGSDGTPTASGYETGGGSGNPGGAAGGGDVGEDGTGGLLVIICSGNITGAGNIESKGVHGGDCETGNGGNGGGATGGGSILVARVGTDATVSKSAAGGVGGLGGTTNAHDGGSGGAGSIITLEISP